MSGLVEMLQDLGNFADTQHTETEYREVMTKSDIEGPNMGT